MFRELVELARDLESKGKLPPPGFYYYREPIKWVVHLWPDRVYIESALIDRPRPFSGRTSDLQAHLLVDEAGYAVGANKEKNGTDRRSEEKHKIFCELLRVFLASESLKDPFLREAIVWLATALKYDRVRKDPRFGEMLSKDWVSFVPETGPLAGKHLFGHSDAKDFWLFELQKRSLPSSKKEKNQVRGECSVCGRENILVGKIPLGVKLAGTTPLHSLNADAFISFLAGTATFKKAHLGLCFECGDTASRAFNYLSNSDQHRRTLLYDKDKRDSLANQIALFWVKATAPIKIGETLLDFSNLDEIDFGAALAVTSGKSAQATASQLLELLKLPWTAVDSNLSLDDYSFYLGIFSPNIGRIALRELLVVSITTLKKNLLRFLEATRMTSSWGDPAQPFPIGTIIQALESNSPNLLRGLLRSAYLGYDPPQGLWTAAVNRFHNPNILQDPREAWRLQALASALKIGIFYHTKEAETMSELNPQYVSQAYHCGRLLAVLERAQQIHYYHRYKKRLDTTIVNRAYGGCSVSPAVTLGGLLRLASTSHLPEAGERINKLIEEISDELVRLGGMPKTLTLAEQGEFGLGFYHQRATLRSLQSNEEKEPIEGGGQ